ncbi:MAG: exonuclease domain-containing protein, partial [Succinivibrionaceae bacterium]|nr:exonuclease domain-containing protein [Succinivibrionaceae bacterium]
MVNGSGMKFFFYDLETFGRYPFRLRQAEFAYCVTDSEFNLIDGQSGALYCAMPPDLLPDPGSVMVTGITPREAAEKGFRENEYVKRIIASFPDSNVCFTGYNNVKFDDECMRALFFRNFEDPYLMSSYFRSYSRLDILPLVRACHALFPETFRAAVK